MNLVAVTQLYLASDFKALWVDLIRKLPKCGECGAPSTHVLQLHPQDVPSYLCAHNACHDKMRAENAGHIEVIDGWVEAPWIDHVVAAWMESR